MASPTTLKVLVCSETFKGTLEAPDVGTTILKALELNSSNGRNIPLSDGGAGFLASMTSAASLKLQSEPVVGPYGEKVNANFGVGTDEQGDRFAVVEMAQACGLPMVQGERNPLHATSFGFGQLLLAAAKVEGVKKIYVGLGGSATNDGAVPALQAMGLLHCRIADKWFDEKQAPLTGKDLCDIEECQINRERLELFPPIILIGDVTNPLLGRDGATAVYGPQKGAVEDSTKKRLEAGLANAATKVQILTPNVELLQIRGGGAAGGAGAFMVAVAGAKWTAGATSFAKIVKLREHIKWADVVITGEGSFDTQTLEHGKTISHVRDLCIEEGKPLIVLCGRCTADAWSTINDDPIVAILSLTPTYPVPVAMRETAKCVAETIKGHWNDLSRRTRHYKPRPRHHM